MPGLTPIEVCNLALLQLGDVTITSFDDGTQTSEMCRLVFPQAQDIVLEAHPFNFATTRGSLDRLADAPAWGWSYQYSLNTDPYCLRVLQMERDAEFEIEGNEQEGRVLLTNEATANVRYIFRNENLLAWNALALEALDVLIGKMLAAAITGQGTRKAALLLEMTQWIDAASTRDAKEGKPQVIPPNTTLTFARHRQSTSLTGGLFRTTG
jgi:hypothetical protein